LICVTNDATSRSTFAARPTLKLTHGREAPVSPIMKSANSSDLEARISAAASSKRRRSVGFTAAHAGNAAAAVSPAAWASCNVAAAARVTKAPVRGSRRSNVRLFEAGTQSLFIRRRASILILQLETEPSSAGGVMGSLPDA
jgi:plasmid stabilization system protein ParE